MKNGGKVSNGNYFIKNDNVKKEYYASRCIDE